MQTEAGTPRPSTVFGWRSLDRFIFPKSMIVRLIVVAAWSFAFAFALTGKQIFSANWGLIDDHDTFEFLVARDRLPISEIGSALVRELTQSQIFRPTYYLIKLLEISFFGSQVHLWYLVNTICFATFLGACWWIMWRYLGGWLSGALTASIALLPLWAGVWSRLGPSEIFGAPCLAVILLCSYALLTSTHASAQRASAIALTLATIVFLGLKETFLPFVFGTICLLLFAGYVGRLRWRLVAMLLIILFAYAVGVAVEIGSKAAATGTDYYGRSIGFVPTATSAIIGMFDGALRTAWLWILPLAFFQILNVIPKKPLAVWLWESRQAAALYLFGIAMYAGQSGLYRASFPSNTRYDFPAMLLLPVTCCLLACEVSNKLRSVFPRRAIDYAQLTAAGFLVFALVYVNVGAPPALAVAVKKNIATTTEFYAELERVVETAHGSPEKPIILDAYGPMAYEPVFSLTIYFRALGVNNTVSVRFHRDPGVGKFSDGLQQALAGLESGGGYTPLQEAVARSRNGCISIGLLGAPDTNCTAFHMESGLN